MADQKISQLPTGTPTDASEIHMNNGGASEKSTMADVRTLIAPKGTIQLPLGSLREIAAGDIQNLAAHGGILASDSTPSYARVNGATDKALRVTWAAGNVDEVQFPGVAMPPDLKETVEVTVHLLAKMSGATDTPTIDVQVFDAIGDTEMGGATAAMSNTLAELTVTLTNADISGHPLGFLNISLIPGAHATDAVELYAAWIEYTRKQQELAAVLGQTLDADDATDEWRIRVTGEPPHTIDWKVTYFEITTTGA